MKPLSSRAAATTAGGLSFASLLQSGANVVNKRKRR